MSRDRLYLEERIGVARDIANHTAGEGPVPREKFNALMLRLIAVLDGERTAVPRRLRRYLRTRWVTP